MHNRPITPTLPRVCDNLKNKRRKCQNTGDKEQPVSAFESFSKTGKLRVCGTCQSCRTFYGKYDKLGRVEKPLLSLKPIEDFSQSERRWLLASVGR